MHMVCKNYLKTLEDTVRQQWNQKALCDYQGEAFTYADVAVSIEQFRIFLTEAGITKRSKIAICARNCARWAMTFWDINVNECVAVPLLADFHPNSISTLTHHSDSVLLFADKKIWEKLHPGQMPNLRAAINVKDGSMLWHRDEKVAQAWENRGKAYTLQHPSGLSKEQVSYPSDNMDKLAIINYTSGTTGNPKGVMLTYGAISDTDAFSNSHFPNQPGETIVSMLPMAHMYGLAIEFIHPNVDGVTVWFLGKTPSPSTLLKAMQTVKPYMVVTVPLVMEKVYANSIKPALDKMKWLTAIPQARKAEFVPGSCGKPVHDLRINSDDPRNVAGEIQVRGANLTIGYYKNPEANAAAFTDDGWFRTGDLGLLDKDNNIFIRGRIKSMILNSSGQNIYPEELEAVLSGCPYVSESLVVERKGRLVALVYPEIPDDLDTNKRSEIPELIRTTANKSLPVYSKINEVVFVDEPFEKTPKMSIKRYLYH